MDGDTITLSWDGISSFDVNNYRNRYATQTIYLEKLLDEVNYRSKQLEEQLDIVSNKDNKQFIKGRLFELNEIRNNILSGYWVCDREPRDFIF